MICLLYPDHYCDRQLKLPGVALLARDMRIKEKANKTSNYGDTMDQRTVRKLERDIEEAIAGVITDMGLKKLPLLPSQQTMHLMAKAAVTVYEAAVENQGHHD